jgi:hypothetical protein
MRSIVKTIIVDNGAQAALKLPLGEQGEHDSGCTTVREYLRELLRKVWTEGGGFSGGHPFGNSGWEYDLYEPLVRAGLIAGKTDEDGYVISCDRAAGDALIAQAIEVMCSE